AVHQFGKLYQELFGGPALDAFRLLRGHDNKTVLAGKSLWYLSRLAQAQPVVRTILEGDASGALGQLGRSEVGRDFLEQFRSYLEEYGERREDLYLERPTWRENPEPVVQHLIGLMSRGDRDITAEMVATWEESERLIAASRERLTGYPKPVRDEFDFLLAAAQEAVVLSEDHNFWIDARSTYHVRQAFIEMGKRLATAGVLGVVEDVFYFSGDELRDILAEAPHRHRQVHHQALV